MFIVNEKPNKARFYRVITDMDTVIACVMLYVQLFD